MVELVQMSNDRYEGINLSSLTCYHRNGWTRACKVSNLVTFVVSC